MAPLALKTRTLSAQANDSAGSQAKLLATASGAIVHIEPELNWLAKPRGMLSSATALSCIAIRPEGNIERDVRPTLHSELLLTPAIAVIRIDTILRRPL